MVTKIYLSKVKFRGTLAKRGRIPTKTFGGGAESKVHFAIFTNVSPENDHFTFQIANSGYSRQVIKNVDPEIAHILLN